jgi:hypothetical protein
MLGFLDKREVFEVSTLLYTSNLENSEESRD